MKRNKLYYKTLGTINGYRWWGFWDCMHHFIKGDNREGYFDCCVSEDDISNGSYKFMLNKNITRMEA